MRGKSRENKTRDEKLRVGKYVILFTKEINDYTTMERPKLKNDTITIERGGVYNLKFLVQY